METSFPLIFPELTRLHVLNGTENALEELQIFIKQYISLIVLGAFENSTLLLNNANKLCIEATAHPKQRILWIKGLEEIVTVRPFLEQQLKTAFPEKEINMDNIRAIAFAPTTQQPTYLIYIDPSLSNDPKDKRRRISTFQMQLAFNAAIAKTSAIAPSDNPDHHSTPII
ncbi:MAG: hypothetical protein HC912_10090 [Saprospiraceae bacterium]|nr:hypothetical protein [Saprospiraceae bacterium]